ncbi:hypothetical protein PPHE_b1012 [Pseudoalteromonas phenolica O-BC30]|nr:hypothetical protein [Pseudoalteromonas phenolica O-BC30]
MFILCDNSSVISARKNAQVKQIQHNVERYECVRENLKLD